MAGMIQTLGMTAWLLAVMSGCSERPAAGPAAVASTPIAREPAAADERDREAIAPVLAKIREAAEGIREYTCAVDVVHTAPAAAGSSPRYKPTISHENIAFKGPDKFFVQQETRNHPMAQMVGEQHQTVMDGVTRWELWIQKSGPMANRLNISKTDIGRLRQAGVDIDKIKNLYPPAHLAEPLMLFEESTVRLVSESETEWVVEGSSRGGNGTEATGRLTFDRSTGLLKKMVFNSPDSVNYDPNHGSTEMTVSQVRVNPEPAIDEKYFVYAPPADSAVAVKDNTDEIIRMFKSD